MSTEPAVFFARLVLGIGLMPLGALLLIAFARGVDRCMGDRRAQFDRSSGRSDASSYTAELRRNGVTGAGARPIAGASTPMAGPGASVTFNPYSTLTHD